MSRTRRSPYLACAATAAAAGLAVSGCGSGGSPSASPGSTSATPTPTQAAKAAVEKATASTEASTAVVEVRVELRKSGASNVLAYRATGSVAPGGGTLTIDRTGIGGGVQHEVFTRVGGRLVIYTSPVTATLPKGKTWLKVDMTKYGRLQYGADTTFLAGADQDPLQALQLLRSPAAKVTDVGEDWLPDHTLNHRYNGTVNVLAAARAAGVAGAGLTRLRAAMGNPTQHIDVWVGEKGRVARVVVRSPEKTAQGTLQLKETTDFTSYGTRAAVKTPPASKTADYFSLSGK
jgi:hypothetical protein